METQQILCNSNPGSDAEAEAILKTMPSSFTSVAFNVQFNYSN